MEMFENGKKCFHSLIEFYVLHLKNLGIKIRSYSTTLSYLIYGRKGSPILFSCTLFQHSNAWFQWHVQFAVFIFIFFFAPTGLQWKEEAFIILWYSFSHSYLRHMRATEYSVVVSQ